MIHAEKDCTVCHEPFMPAADLTPIQAEEIKTCGDLCAKKAAGSNKRFRSGANGMQADTKFCPCVDCAKLREGDRKARVAEYLAKTGKTAAISEGPRRSRSPQELARAAAANREARKDYGDFDDRWQLPCDYTNAEPCGMNGKGKDGYAGEKVGSRGRS